MTAVRILVDGRPGATVSVLDRGLGYGDGLFESIRFVGRTAPLWPRHMQRLAEGCARLRIPMPDEGVVLSEVRSLLDDAAQSVARITVTRGVGARGYAVPVHPSPSRVVAVFDAPVVDCAAYREGVRTRWCDLRLAAQPRLAGLKHLNRLEQVLARSEWSDPAIAEGLLCDEQGRVICATMANLFAVLDGTLHTPALDRCGVAGVARAEVLAFMGATVADLDADALGGAEEVFLTSSVRGILPVQSVGDRVFAPGPVARALQHHWRDLGFPMEQA